MRPFAFESSAFTFAVAAAVVAAGVVSTRRRSRLVPPVCEGGPAPSDASLAFRGAVAWALTAGLALAVELWELFHSPRNLYPTLSSLANEVIGPGHRLGRALAFVCWGAFGLVIVSSPEVGP